MTLVSYLREIIMSDGLIILSIFCFYIASLLSKSISFCNKNISSDNTFEIKSVISFWQLLKGIILGLGGLFLLNFLNLSGEDLGQAFKSLFNLHNDSEGSGTSIVKFIALIMTVISGLVLSIAHKQVEKLDKELETIRDKSETAVCNIDNEITKIKETAETELKTLRKKSETAVNNVRNEITKIKKDILTARKETENELKNTVNSVNSDIELIKKKAKNELLSLKTLKENLNHISYQNVAIIELNKLIQDSRKHKQTIQELDFDAIRSLLGYNSNTMSSIVIIDAISALLQNPINKEWFADNEKFSDYIKSLYQHFSEIENKSTDVEHAMLKIGEFVPDLIIPLSMSLVERAKINPAMKKSMRSANLK